MKSGDVVWSRVLDLHSHQWIRVVVDYVYSPDGVVSVRPLFPGDAKLPVWMTRVEFLRTEEPSFDEIDASYGDDSEFSPA